MIIALFPSLFVLRYLLFYFFIKDALLRGSVGNLSRLDLSGNKIKSLEKLTQFVKASQALQVLFLAKTRIGEIAQCFHNGMHPVLVP